MSVLTQEWFSFQSRALEDDAFSVLSFKGIEGLSQCYRFITSLTGPASGFDTRQVLDNPVVFRIHRPQGDVLFNGILAGFEQHQAYGDTAIYTADLAPRFWWLTMTHHNQVFLNQTLPEILTSVLQDGGLSSGRDFELRLEKDYPRWEYVCQYQESHFNFVSRWMERDGLYYFFEQNDEGEKLIITDTNLAHTPMPQGDSLRYSPPSGLEGGHLREIITDFICRRQAAPNKVLLKDYNYRTPSVEMEASADVSPTGQGTVFIYGEHFRTPEEGGVLASIRAQELLCRETQYFGESFISFIRPGYTFTLEDHFRDEFNRDYLTVETEHSGNQTAYLTAGLKNVLAGIEAEPRYANSFTAIPAGVQFRPVRQSPKPRIAGSMNAHIDAAGSGQYAELDDQGRYKVVLPFDLSGRSQGKASAFVRKAQPYAGANHGLHFPLHKGTEVLLSFLDGDPDRPIITGAVPNPDHPSPVTAENQTRNILATAGGNQIYMEDEEGNQRILMQSPSSDTWVRMGEPNDPGAEEEHKDHAGWTWSSKDGMKIGGGAKNEVVIGESVGLYTVLKGSITLGVDNKTVIGLKTDVNIGRVLTVHAGGSYKYESENYEAALTKVQSTTEQIADYINDQHVVATRNIVQASVTRVIGEQSQAVLNHVDVAGVRTQVTDEVARLTNLSIGAHANDLDVVEQRMKAINVAVKNMGVQLQTAGDRLDTAGTAIENHGVDLTQSGEELENAGVVVRDAELTVE